MSSERVRSGKECRIKKIAKIWFYWPLIRSKLLLCAVCTYPFSIFLTFRFSIWIHFVFRFLFSFFSFLSSFVVHASTNWFRLFSAAVCFIWWARNLFRHTFGYIIYHILYLNYSVIFFRFSYATFGLYRPIDSFYRWMDGIDIFLQIRTTQTTHTSYAKRWRKKNYK